jgi:hypothetical protein
MRSPSGLSSSEKEIRRKIKKISWLNYSELENIPAWFLSYLDRPPPSKFVAPVESA